MGRNKNLSTDDLQELNFYEDQMTKKNEKINGSSSGKLELHKHKLNVKCLNEKQKELKKMIENKDITIVTGVAGCLTKNEKIRIYKLKK